MLCLRNPEREKWNNDFALQHDGMRYDQPARWNDGTLLTKQSPLDMYIALDRLQEERNLRVVAAKRGHAPQPTIEDTMAEMQSRIWANNSAGRSPTPVSPGKPRPDKPTQIVPEPVNRDARVLVDGEPVPKDDSHTEIDPKTGLQKDYVVLSAEERAKGYMRPVRRSYTHVGPPGPKHPLRDLTDAEKKQYEEINYVKYEEYPKNSNALGRYWTQKQLDAVDKGCGAVTRMAQAIAETYARDPSFYGATFCIQCGTHLPVGEQGEFVWLDNPDQRVGS